jgi:phosphoribosylamine--glycine ligase
MAEVAENLAIADSDFDAIVAACKEHRIDLVVVGNEDPLAAGLVDRLAVEGIAAFGPTRAAAEIESSKSFAKDLMLRHSIPTAPFAAFDDAAAARDYVWSQPGPFVVKADGLARGKGTVVTRNAEQAVEAIDAMMVERVFGASGDRIVIEQRLAGPEVSAMAFTDGKALAHLPFSCDHKAVFDGDEGPNTGGMGAFSPAGWLDRDIAVAIERDISERAVRAMDDEGRPYQGVLYPGIMVTDDGPIVIEFNCRLGDPEAQVLLPRLETDLLEVCSATANNRLHEVDVSWSDKASVGVVVASGGYPGDFATGLPISGLGDIDDDVLVFQAGTSREADGSLVTAGGRVLTVSATGATIEEAREKAYRNVQRLRFAGMHYRRDIGLRGQPVAGSAS